MKRQLSLDYEVVFGALAPYAEALGAGIAMASACVSCGAVSFPPRPTCGRCQSSHFSWQQLPGTARIFVRTESAGGSFALVQFDGADIRSVVRLNAIPPETVRGHLIAPRDELLGLWLGADAPAAGKEE